MAKQIYLDFNASTPLAPEVIEVMSAYLHDHYGNPSSGHWAGAPANAAVAQARKQTADAIGAHPNEIVFTSGGTEASNHAIKGVYFRGPRDAHVITTAIEHPATLMPCAFLERLGASVTILPVDSTGQVDPDDVRRAITPKTRLISVMQANNEVGTLQPIAAIGQIAKERGIVFHCDAAQSLGKVPVNVVELGVDLLSIAGHKLYAPKGVGALYIRHGIELEPLMHGAGHEAGRRAGTENVLGIVALGAACQAAVAWAGRPQIAELCDHFWRRLQETFGPRVVLNGHRSQRLPNTLNVGFVGQNAIELLDQIPEVAASRGSACHSGHIELSPVLKAMGVAPEVGAGAIRFSLGRTSTREELDFVVDRLAEVSKA